MNSPTISHLRLFLATFVSAFLFLFGVGTLLLMFAPALASIVTSDPTFTPQLPVAADASPQSATPPTPTPLVVKEYYPPLPTAEGADGSNRIYIPSIGVNIPLVMSASIADTDVLATLNKGAALYPNGVLPGHLGNAFIAAHSTGEPWKGKYRFAFIKINELTPGHLINLDYNGARYTYRVVKQTLVKPNSNYQIVSDRPVPTVTLMACWPLWTTSQRMLITAELTNITKLTVRPS